MHDTIMTIIVPYTFNNYAETHFGGGTVMLNALCFAKFRLVQVLWNLIFAIWAWLVFLFATIAHFDHCWHW